MGQLGALLDFSGQSKGLFVLLKPYLTRLGSFWRPPAPSGGHVGGFLGRFELTEARKGENAVIIERNIDVFCFFGRSKDCSGALLSRSGGPL